MASFKPYGPKKVFGKLRFSGHELTKGREDNNTVAGYGTLLLKVCRQLQAVEKRIELDTQRIPRSGKAESQTASRLRFNQNLALKIRAKISEHFKKLRKKLTPAAFERFCAYNRISPADFIYSDATPRGVVRNLAPGVGRGPHVQTKPSNGHPRTQRVTRRTAVPRMQTSTRTPVGRPKLPVPVPDTSNPLDDLVFNQKLASVLQNLEQYTKSNEPLTLTSERRHSNPAVEASSLGSTDWSEIDQKLASVMQNLEKCSQPNMPLKYKSGMFGDNLSVSSPGRNKAGSAKWSDMDHKLASVLQNLKKCSQPVMPSQHKSEHIGGILATSSPGGSEVGYTDWSNIDQKLATVLQNLKKCSQPGETVTSKSGHRADKPAAGVSPTSTDWSDIDQKLTSVLQNLDKCSQSDKPLQYKGGQRPPDKTAVVAPLRSDVQELRPQPPCKPPRGKSEPLDDHLATGKPPLINKEKSLDWPEIDRRLVTVLQNLDKCTQSDVPRTSRNEHGDKSHANEPPQKVKRRSSPNCYPATPEYKETRTVRINRSPSLERRRSSGGDVRARSKERFDVSKVAPSVRVVSQRDNILVPGQNLWSRRTVDNSPAIPPRPANRSPREIRISPQRTRSAACVTSVYSRASPPANIRSQRSEQTHSDPRMPSSSVQSHSTRSRHMPSRSSDAHPQPKLALFGRRSSVERAPPTPAQRPNRRIEARAARIQQDSVQRAGDRIARSKPPPREEFRGMDRRSKPPPREEIRGRERRSNASQQFGAMEPKWSRPGTTPSLVPIPSLAEILSAW